jgi:glycosyltransferase involved in cell wall biosynthesis
MAGARPGRIYLLYVSSRGLLDPAGRSQVVALPDSPRGEIAVSAVTFEKRKNLADEGRRSALETELTDRGISWAPLAWHRSPPIAGAASNLLRGSFTSVAIARRRDVNVVHARGYAAGLIGLGVKALTGARLLFEMRGFSPEEAVEMGRLRPQSLVYRAAKLFEKRLLASADHVVVLTESAKAILREREAKSRLASPGVREAPISVVPSAVDLDRFHPAPRDLEIARRHGLESSLVIGNIGAFNNRYLAFEMFRFAFHVKAHRPDLRFVYLTGANPEGVRHIARDAGLEDRDVLIERAEAEDVPRWLSLFRFGVFFLRPSYAAKGSGLAKLGEFLAAGVPVVANTGVGDVDRILASERGGLVLSGLTDRDLSSFARKALPLLEGDAVPEEVRRQCRALAFEHFALSDTSRRYRAIYESLASLPHPEKDVPIAAEVG